MDNNDEKPKPFIPPPVFEQSTVLLVGGAVFLLALVWPPLILVATYLLSVVIPYSYRTNDEATNRRMLSQKFSKQPGLPSKWTNIPSNIVFEEGYWVNARGMCLHTSTMVPANGEVKAVLCFCHGYTDNASWVKRIEYQRFVQEGVAVVTIEYEGHGLSDGQLGYIENWDLLIDDVETYFEETMTSKFPSKKCFLMGESMGGAVCFCAYKRNPQRYSGVVFVAPMCKISPKMMPPPFVVNALYWILATFPFTKRLPLAPAKGELKDLAFKMPDKRDMAQWFPTIFARKPRLMTASELLEVTSSISSSLSEFDAPFLVQHGLDDKVTDPLLSQALYDESKSKDKTILLYKGMWHTLTCGEPDENIEQVYKDAIEWVLARA